MDRSWYLRFTVVVIAVTLAFGALWPSLDKAGWLAAPEWVMETFPGRISPGLDIRGGLRLMYEVEVDEYIRDRRDRDSERMVRELGVILGVYEDDEKDSASREQLAEVQERITVQTVGDRAIRVLFNDAADREYVTTEWLNQTFPDFRLTGGTNSQIDLGMREDRVDELTTSAVQQAVLTIEQRVDGMGLREATVIGRDSDIIVEVPGADESVFDDIRETIARTARLEFKPVDEEDGEFLAQFRETLPEGIVYASEQGSPGENAPATTLPMLIASGEPCAEDAPEDCQGPRERLQAFVDSIEDQIPDTHQVLLGEEDRASWKEARDIPQSHEAWRTYYVFKVTNVTGEDVEEARWTFSQDPQSGSGPVVLLSFSASGASKWADLTGRNVQRRVAIVLDDRVASAPQIQSRIEGGNTQITLGGGSDLQAQEEAEKLVVVLNAGALPAPLRPGNEQLIGPTLGSDSVARGAKGAAIGVGLVLLFMLLYYEVAGFVADIMVLLNLLFLLALMSAFNATLTLPGVAAIALTVGMAVDANVLITERIREEQRAGKSPRSAVDQGFGRAFSSVFDSQITTFIAGVVLYQYGTGPIKGFAVMLMFGIISSLFTGIFCSKVMLDWIVRGLRVKRLRAG